MTAVSRIEEVLRGGLLDEDLVTVPTTGATEDEISAEAHRLGYRFPMEFVSFLSRWNGINLEVIRIYGCSETSPDIGQISSRQLSLVSPMVAFGSDPIGLVFAFGEDGRVYAHDTDGGGVEQIANGFDDFVERVVFGEDAAAFAGEDWLEELRSHGLL